MPTVTDNAICIRRWDYSETSQTVSLFLRDHGLVRGIVKGAKRAGGSFDGGVDVLTHGQVVMILTPSRELATVTAWHVLEAFRPLRERLAANRCGLYMVDLVHHMLTEHDAHPLLFDALRESLAAMGDTPRVGRTLLVWVWALLCETGYQPRLDRDAETGSALPAEAPTLAFSSAAGGVVADTGEADRWRVRRETIDLLREVAAGRPPADIEPRRLERANRLLAAYLRPLLGREPPAMTWLYPDLAT